MFLEPTHKLKQGSFNGKPKATVSSKDSGKVAFGLPLNESMHASALVFV